MSTVFSEFKGGVEKPLLFISIYLVNSRNLLKIYRQLTLYHCFFPILLTFERSFTIVSAITSEYNCVVVSFV